MTIFLTHKISPGVYTEQSECGRNDRTGEIKKEEKQKISPPSSSYIGMPSAEMTGQVKWQDRKKKKISLPTHRGRNDKDNRNHIASLKTKLCQYLNTI